MPFHPTTDPGDDQRGPRPIEASPAYQRMLEERSRKRNRYIAAGAFVLLLILVALVTFGC